jgi:hypothetical protein
MTPSDDKRSIRNLKRAIKKAGNRKRRNHLKRALDTTRDAEPLQEFAFGRDSSAALNGNDHDATRRHDEEEHSEEMKSDR